MPTRDLAEFDGDGERTLLFTITTTSSPPSRSTSGPCRHSKEWWKTACSTPAVPTTRATCLCLAAIDAWRQARGRLPCRVKFLIEGEEEIGSPSLPDYLRTYRDLFQADACIWKYGNRDPAGRLEVGLGLKGLLYVELEVEIASSDLHSGYGAWSRRRPTGLSGRWRRCATDGGRC